MLDDWEENLAIITANRTNDDGLVMIHLGDCLWKEKGEVGILQIQDFAYNLCKT
jgi:COPII coat assembly protein SEC16